MRLIPFFLLLLTLLIPSAGTSRAEAPLQILPAEVMEKAPAGGDFATALHVRVDFASQAGEEEFAGRFFNPAEGDWASGKALKVWIRVDGEGSMFDGKIRAYRQSRFVDLPISVQGDDFGKWQMLTIDLQNLPADDLSVLEAVDNVYVFTSRAWVGASAVLDVFIAEISLAAKQ